MKINRVTAVVQVRGDYLKCYNFYTEKIGLVPFYGAATGPYTSFTNQKGGEPFFAMYCAKDASERLTGFNISKSTESTDTLSATFHTNDFAADYNRMLDAGVVFISKDTMGEGAEAFNIAYFRDTEGNLLSLEDGGV